jgi:hypothetical protein
MASVFKGQSAGKSEQIVLLSTPSTTDASAVQALFEAHRRKVDKAFGVPRSMLGRDHMLTSVFPAAAVPSFRILGARLALAEVAAMDAVEGRAGFARSPLSRFDK